jgi:menaquinol-cytochrome c reductase iron-sulfur subunit
MTEHESPSQDASPDTAQPSAAGPDRRNVLGWLAVGLGVVASAALGIPVVGYLLGSLIKPKPDEWVDLGPVEGFPAGQTRLARFPNPDHQPWDGEVGRIACYVRRIADQQFAVFAVNCTHLGCPVSWFPDAGLFLCPCHGGVYYANGSRASGPPPRGLYQYDWQVRDGHLWIRAGHLPTLQDTPRAEGTA